MAKPRKKAEAPAELGHNSAEEIQKENEEKALFFHHMRRRMAFNEEMDAIREEWKAEAKVAKADGIDIGELDYAIKALSAEDKQTVTDKYFANTKVLKWLGFEVGYQVDLFKDRAAAFDRIEKDGERAGLAALLRTSGYDVNSDEDIRWNSGYDNGQAIVRDNLQAAMEKKNAERMAKANELIKQDRPVDDLDDGDSESYAESNKEDEQDWDDAAPKEAAAVN